MVFQENVMMFFSKNIDFIKSLTSTNDSIKVQIIRVFLKIIYQCVSQLHKKGACQSAAIGSPSSLMWPTTMYS